MKVNLILGITVVSASIAILAAPSFAAEDGAALYKSKCAGCHGANGEGKPAVKAPAVKGTSLTTEQIVEHLTKGEATSTPPHNKGMSSVTETQAKAIAEFVKTLK